jgi:coenzyme F420-reducing hydrogenase alpha subunit
LPLKKRRNNPGGLFSRKLPPWSPRKSFLLEGTRGLAPLPNKEDLMSELLKEMSAMSGKLHSFIIKTKDKEEQKKLLEKYFQLNDQVEKLAKQTFDENDGFYQDTIDKIMETERVIKEFKAKQIELINVFVHLIDIIANVEKIILGWKTGNGK